MLAFTERAEEELPFDPKDRIDTPEPDYCEECNRWAFLRSGWDMFGGNNAGGFCIACGYELSEDEAYERAVEHALLERVNDGTCIHAGWLRSPSKSIVGSGRCHALRPPPRKYLTHLLM